MAGVVIAGTCERGQGLPRPSIRIIQKRCAYADELVIDRQNAAAETGLRVALRTAGRIFCFAITLEECGVQEAHQWEIQSIEPDHGVVALITVVVPGP